MFDDEKYWSLLGGPFASDESVQFLSKLTDDEINELDKAYYDAEFEKWVANLDPDSWFKLPEALQKKAPSACQSYLEDLARAQQTTTPLTLSRCEYTEIWNDRLQDWEKVPIVLPDISSSFKH